MTENELKHAVLRLAKQNGWAVYHVPQARIANGGGAGYPDLTLARDGEVLWIELKQQKAQPTALQLEWAAALGRPWHLIRPSDWDSGRVGELLR
jgi:Holliday junction resolvase